MPVRVLECRDRSKAEDVTWIEQLATKSRDHGVPVTAVSSKGVSRSAIDKAKAYGIETRTISKITQDEMKDWIRILEVSHLVNFPVIEAVDLIISPEAGDTEPALHATVVEKLDAGPADAPMHRS